MRSIDVNSDLGEGFGPFRVGADDELFPLISSANIACGAHGGDPLTMAQTVRKAALHGVAVGAHPGFPDRSGFGRRTMALTPDEIRAEVIAQTGALAAFCRAEGIPLHHVKAHGALYNVATTSPLVATAIAQAISDIAPELLVYALPNSELENACRDVGLRVAREAFADRTYQPDGTLTPRTSPGAVIHDPIVAASRIVRLVTEGVLEAIDGSLLHLTAETMCIHSDTEGAVAIATELARQLDAAEIARCAIEPCV